MAWDRMAESANYVGGQNGRCHHMAAMWASRVRRGWGVQQSVPAFANAFPLAAEGVAGMDAATVYIEYCHSNHAPADAADLNHFINNAVGTHVATLGFGHVVHTIAFTRRGGISYVYDPDTGVWGGDGTLAELADLSAEFSQTLSALIGAGVVAGGHYRVHQLT